MEFYVPPINQGQIVEVAYAAWRGVVFRRTRDRGDGSVVYAMAEMAASDRGDYWNAPPTDTATDWEEIPEAQIWRALEG